MSDAVSWADFSIIGEQEELTARIESFLAASGRSTAAPSRAWSARSSVVSASQGGPQYRVTIFNAPTVPVIIPYSLSYALAACAPEPCAGIDDRCNAFAREPSADGARRSSAEESDLTFARGARAWFSFGRDFLLVRTAFGDSDIFGNVPRADARAVLGAVRLAADSAGLFGVPVLAQIGRPSQGQAVGSAWHADADGRGGGAARSFKTSVYPASSALYEPLGTLNGLAQHFIGKIVSPGELLSGSAGVPASAYTAAASNDSRGLLKSVGGDASAALRWRLLLPATHALSGWDIDVLAVWPGRALSGGSRDGEACLPPEAPACALHPKTLLDAPLIAFRAASRGRNSFATVRTTLTACASSDVAGCTDIYSERWLVSALAHGLWTPSLPASSATTCPSFDNVEFDDRIDEATLSVCRDFIDATILATGTSADINVDETFYPPPTSAAPRVAPPALPVAATAVILTAAARGAEAFSGADERGSEVALGAETNVALSVESAMGDGYAAQSLYAFGEATLRVWGTGTATLHDSGSHALGVSTSPSAAAGAISSAEVSRSQMPQWLQRLRACGLSPDDIADSIPIIATTSECAFVEIAVRHCWTVLAGEEPADSEALAVVDEIALRVIATTWFFFLRHVRDTFERATAAAPPHHHARVNTVSANEAAEAERAAIEKNETSLFAQRLEIVTKATESLIAAVCRSADAHIADINGGHAGSEHGGRVDDASNAASGSFTVDTPDAASAGTEYVEEEPQFDYTAEEIALAESIAVTVQLSPALAEDEYLDAARSCVRAGLVLGPTPRVRCAPTPALIMSDISAFRDARPAACLRDFLLWYCGAAAPLPSKAWRGAWAAAVPRPAAAQQRIATPQARGEAALSSIENAAMADVIYDLLGAGVRAAVSRAMAVDGGGDARARAAIVRDSLFAEDAGNAASNHADKIAQENAAAENAARSRLAAAAGALARDGKNRALARAFAAARPLGTQASGLPADMTEERGAAAKGVELAATAHAVKNACKFVALVLDYETARVRAAALASALEAACDVNVDGADSSAAATNASALNEGVIFDGASTSHHIEGARAKRHAEARALAQCAAAATWSPPLDERTRASSSALSALLDDEGIAAPTDGVMRDFARGGIASPWATVRGPLAREALLRLLRRARPGAAMGTWRILHAGDDDKPFNELLPAPTVSAIAITSDAVRDFWPQPRFDCTAVRVEPQGFRSSAHAVVAVTTHTTLRIALSLSEYE